MTLLEIIGALALGIIAAIVVLMLAGIVSFEVSWSSGRGGQG